MKDTHLCACIGCGIILIDHNPPSDAPLFENKGFKEMTQIEDETGEIFTGCPECLTDNTLSDIEDDDQLAYLIGLFAVESPEHKDMYLHGMIFDDYYLDGNGTWWTQLCKEHAEGLQPLEEFGSPNIECGVKGCHKEADYYIDNN
jgi:hypothetical protein